MSHITRIPAFRRDVPAEVSSFVNFTELYIDGPGPENILGNELKFLVTDTASLE